MSHASAKSKSERALELYDKGLTPSQIGERIGSTGRSVSAMLCHARAEREMRLAKVVEVAQG